MFVIVLIVCSFIAYPVYVCWKDSLEIDLIVEVKNFSSPYYMFGMYFFEHELGDEEYIEQEFVIALYFLTFKMIAYKYKNDA